MSEREIYQSTDLAQRRTEVIHAARTGKARVRDKDGMSLIMLPERNLELLEVTSAWSQRLLRLLALLEQDRVHDIVALGDLAWLRAFDDDEIREFVDEMRDALIAAAADEDVAVVNRCVHEWRVTARQLEDPLRRAVLLGNREPGDFVEAGRPSDD